MKGELKWVYLCAEAIGKFGGHVEASRASVCDNIDATLIWRVTIAAADLRRFGASPRVPGPLLRAAAATMRQAVSVAE